MVARLARMGKFFHRKKKWVLALHLERNRIDISAIHYCYWLDIKNFIPVFIRHRNEWIVSSYLNCIDLNSLLNSEVWCCGGYTIETLLTCDSRVSTLQVNICILLGAVDISMVYFFTFFFTIPAVALYSWIIVYSRPYAVGCWVRCEGGTWHLSSYLYLKHQYLQDYTNEVLHAGCGGSGSYVKKYKCWDL